MTATSHPIHRTEGREAHAGLAGTGQPVGLPVIDDVLWHEFHAMVTMSSVDLRAWLGSHEREVSDLSEALCLALGRRVAALVDAPRSSLTADDIRVVRAVVTRIGALCPEHDPDGELRWQLTALGHDPARCGR